MPDRNDVAVASVLAAYGLVEAALQGAPPGWYLGVVAATAPLAFRRQAPAAVIAWTIFMVLVPGLLSVDGPDTVLPLPLFVVCGYTAGRQAPDARSAALAALAMGAAITIGFAALDERGENTALEDAVALVVIVGGSVAAGQLLRRRRSENLALEALAGELAAERDARAQAAVAEERARVARELHDIVAHSVSLIAVQASAADELMGHDDDRARAALRSVQDTARGAMAEMRRLLVVLREDGSTPALEPQPGLGALDDLVDQARSAGVAVELRRSGNPRPLAPGLDLSAYRIVQEALTNVRKHAGAVSAEVAVSYEPDGLAIAVVNDTAGPVHDRTGHGLIGMRERARLYGGTLEAGRDGKRFVVRARLPFAEATT